MNMTINEFENLTPYSTTKMFPVRFYGEAFTFFKLWGDISKQDVLHLGCASGFITNLLISKGVNSICAVDSNATNIEHTKKNIQKRERVDFVTSKISEIKLYAQFDLVTGAFVFNEAASQTDLESVLDKITTYTKPSKRICFEFDNAELCTEYDWSQFGVPIYQWLPNQIGKKYKVKFESDTKINEVELSYFSAAEIKNLLTKRGFVDIKFTQIEIDPVGLEKLGCSYWRQHLDCPISTFVTATKLPDS